MTLSPIQNYSFDRNTQDLINSNLSISNLTSIGAAPYTDIFGNIFWGILFSAIFISLWIRQEDVTIPALLGLIISGSIFYLMDPAWEQMAESLAVVAFGGLIYSIVKGRN